MEWNRAAETTWTEQDESYFETELKLDTDNGKKIDQVEKSTWKKGVTWK